MKRSPAPAPRGRLPEPSSKPRRLRPLPVGRDDYSLIDIRPPMQSFSDLVLPQNVVGLFAEVHLELQREEWLRSHGVAARRSFLLVGPPGTGKSATGEALADELGRELAVVNLAAVMSSYLGDTSKNLVSILEAAAQEPWVLLMDEIDALGKERGDRTDHAELSRVVNAVLQLLDRFSGPSILVGTCNHPELLDRALWRRFDEVLRYDLPHVHDIRTLLRLKLRPIPKARDVKIERLASLCQGLTQADVSRVVIDAYRHQLLHEPDGKLSMPHLERSAAAAQQRQSSSTLDRKPKQRRS